MTDRDLLNMARDAMKNSHSPYSLFPAGAAVECADGDVFTGCSIENAAQNSSLCAEVVAIASAVAEGKRDFLRIAITSDGTNYSLPCGSCRQFIYEFAPDIEVLASRGDGRYVSYPLSQLYPYPYKHNRL